MTRCFFTILMPVAAMLVTLVASSLYAQTETTSAEKNSSTNAVSPEIAEWIGQLDDNRYLVREKATQALVEAGVVSLDPLLAVANSERLEPADRAVWIMRQLAKAPDNNQAIAALERLVQIKGRPALVEKADLELAERSVRACQERLAPLGAELTMEPRQFEVTSVVPLLSVTLGEKWRGTAEDLRCLAELRRQLYYRFEGEAVDDTVARFFEEKEKLAFAEFWKTKVTPAAVDAIKSRHPEARVYVRGRALLGVQARQDIHPAGVMVSRVEPGTAAFAAGIVAGDVIASIDGNSLPDFDRLTAHIAQHQPGETIPIEIIRGNDRRKVAVTLGSWPGQE
jgi:hypothetical protein